MKTMGGMLVAALVVACSSSSDGPILGPMTTATASSSSAATGAGGATSSPAASSSASTGGTGGAPQCMIASDCPAPADALCFEAQCFDNLCDFKPAITCNANEKCNYGECCVQGQDVQVSTNCPSGFYGSAFSSASGGSLTCSPVCGAQVTACCYPHATDGCSASCPPGYVAKGSPIASTACGASEAIVCAVPAPDGGV